MIITALLKKKKVQEIQLTSPSRSYGFPYGELEVTGLQGMAEMRLYDTLREAVPIIDAAIGKILRLMGGFSVICKDEAAQEPLEEFLRNVQVDTCGIGIHTFILQYFDQLLTYGTSVGEIVVDNHGIPAGLYHVPLEDVALLPGEGPMDMRICSRSQGGTIAEIPYPQRILVSAIQPKAGKIMGESILKGLPFVSGILLKIYHTIGLNWERVGNVRFAVTYKPSSDGMDKAFAKERAEQIAREWSRAMEENAGGRVSDFVSVGDINIKVIGADNQILDSNVPVRQILEQIVAKLSIPPFLLGLSWSSTERMSAQQADILTSELESYRCMLNPVISRICRMWLLCNGYSPEHQVEWDNINLQDELELANARLLNAQAREIEIKIQETRENEGGMLL